MDLWYKQSFCGYKAYDDSKLPFDPSQMVYFRKCLTPEILGEINEMIIKKRRRAIKTEEKQKDKQDPLAKEEDNESGTSKNKGRSS